MRSWSDIMNKNYIYDCLYEPYNNATCEIKNTQT